MDGESKQIQANPIPSLLELVKKGDATTIEQVKETATGSLVIYIMNCIEKNDLKRAEAATKLLDLVHRHSPKAVKDDQGPDYSSFIEGLKK